MNECRSRLVEMALDQDYTELQRFSAQMTASVMIKLDERYTDWLRQPPTGEAFPFMQSATAICIETINTLWPDKYPTEEEANCLSNISLDVGAQMESKTKRMSDPSEANPTKRFTAMTTYQIIVDTMVESYCTEIDTNKRGLADVDFSRWCSARQ